MNKHFIPPYHAQIIPLLGSAIVVTMADLQKREGSFKIFETVEEARLWVHECSKNQFPEYHEKECRFCKTGYGL